MSSVLSPFLGIREITAVRCESDKIPSARIWLKTSAKSPEILPVFVFSITSDTSKGVTGQVSVHSFSSGNLLEMCPRKKSLLS